MLGWRSQEERDLEEELRFHLEKAEAAGQARREAAALFGGVEAIKEECREQRAGARLESVGRDVKLGARILRRSPGFTLAAVLTLALCIGAFTAMFSVLDQVMLRVPPFPKPDRIMTVVSVLNGDPAFGNPLWAGDYEDFRSGAPAFSALAAYDHRNFNLGGGGISSSGAEHLGGMAVLQSAIALYGVAAFAAAQRQRDMALGASAFQMYRLLLGGGLRLTLIGAAAGCGLGWLGLRLLVANVADGQLHLLPLLAIPALLLGTIAAGATYLPVRRALRSSPMAALREE